jgi:hypothetical protein
MNRSEDKPFYDIGLVMAGAVSAGAYTAGVIDFLFQALDEWQKAKDRGEPGVPDHRVRLSVMAGSSAGGMTGSVAAVALNSHHDPVTTLPGREPNTGELERNRLYRSWVEEIDIRYLLETRDLEKDDSKVVSILDSTVLAQIAQKAIQCVPKTERKAYVAEQLQLLMTVTNLRGVPYNIEFKGMSGGGHAIAQHTDHMEFIVSESRPENRRVLWLNPNDPDSVEWSVLRESALATGAFPGGLAPRYLNRNRSIYDHRQWPVPLRPDDQDNRCSEMITIKPDWPEVMRTQTEYSFLSVDGGVMDNEPLELARRALAGPEGFNARHPDKSTRSVILVDPFPSENTADHVDEQDEDDLLSVFGALFGSLLTQARFKPEELILANSDQVYSRFLIAPTRRNAAGEREKYPIACGTLGGFGGFLSQRFRMHDFQLGRRNCQHFLRSYFAIPAEACQKNPVFSHYTHSEIETHSIERDGKRFMPVIPLTGSAKEQAFPLRWDVLGMSESELKDLRRMVDRRTRAVSDKLVNQYMDRSLSRTALRLLARMKRRSIVDSIMSKIESELEEYGLRG